MVNVKSRTPAADDPAQQFDTLCLSHLRWDFVYQRPQHLMSRFTRRGRVFYFEEPVFTDGETTLRVNPKDKKLYVLTPHIAHAEREQGASRCAALQSEMLRSFLAAHRAENYMAWYYTPMALEFTEELKPAAIVYDCMDELTAFRFAPPELRANEQKLLTRADLVFTGGHSLFEAKRGQHPRVYPFPSSIDAAHFRQARNADEIIEPPDQIDISRPRFGFCGVIDERFDIALLAELADLRPAWQFVMVGPVVKISPDELPRRVNIHYLGGKDYRELPAYLAGWDVALMPFALNESTRFISPTKTPEYLAAGLPVISTPIRDVVTPYGEKKLVEIAATTEEFAAAGERLLRGQNSAAWLEATDAFLAQMSWDKTWAEMTRLIDGVIARDATSGERAVSAVAV